MPKVSVVLPIYNVEKYLRKCLDSVINQTLKDIEIICVNDCSSDNSESIIKEYINKDNRVKLINHKENQGLGFARNSGLLESRADYVSFIDSDDFVSEDFIEELYNTAVKNDADIVFTNNIYTVNENNIKPYYHNRINIWKRKFRNSYIEGISNFNVNTEEKENTPEYPLVVAWNKLYKKNFLIKYKLLYSKYRLAEDVDMFYRFLVYNPKMYYNNNAKYYYLQRSTSLAGNISHTKNIPLAMLEVFDGTTTFQDFDGVGKPNRPGDNMLSLTAGISFSVGRTGWKRAVDATPCLYQNEQLVRMTNKLIESNRYYATAHERDRKALAELKKILEIEGILEDYSHLFVADSTKANDYPKNNYSGLNSLMARLKNKKWNGQFVSEMQDSEPTVPSGIPVDSLNISKNYSSFNGRDTLGYRSSVKGDTITDNYLSMLKTGKLYVGAPVYFFFELGSTNLTDKSQLINLDELARIALKYKLCVSVVGAADSATGSDSINNSLGIKRAEYIADELKSRGIADECILKDNKGGIAQFSPEKANRHTKVLLMLKE